MPALQRLFLTLLALLAALPLAPAAQAPAVPRGEALLERVAVIGASASAGYGLGADAHKKPLTLARVIESGLLSERATVIDASSELTFVDPLRSTKVALKSLEVGDPTLVVALDYLFWFGYGASWGGEDKRLAALERGLQSLEGLRCPILLGDFPDMRSALKAKAPILPAAAVPEPATLAKLNERLAAWAKEHPNVIIVPLSKLMGALLAGEELRVGPNLWSKDSVSALLQPDGLHPTLEGTTAIWLFAVERLLEARKDVPRSAFESKAGTIDAKLAPDRKLVVLYAPIREGRGKSTPTKIVH